MLVLVQCTLHKSHKKAVFRFFMFYNAEKSEKIRRYSGTHYKQHIIFNSTGLQTYV